MTFDQATNATVNNVISGSGSIAKAGTGTLTLAGNNTYSGATTVNSGQLSAASTTAFSASSAFTLNGSASLNLNGNNSTIGSLASALSFSVVDLGTAGLPLAGDDAGTTFAAVSRAPPV